jgi:hypothetical protein
MHSTIVEKAPLSLEEPHLDIEAQDEVHDTRNNRRREIAELSLLYLCLFFTVFQFIALYRFSGTPPSLTNRYYALLFVIARGLRISIPATAPTTAVLLIVAPYITRPDRTVVARYAILLCYLVGSTVSALFPDLKVTAV